MGGIPRTAHAQDDFDRYLSSAVQLYQSLEYEEALEQLQRAKKLARGIEQDVAVALYEGIILADMGKEEPSRVAFRRALTLNPEAELPIKVSPKVELSFVELRASVQRGLARRPKPPPPAPSVPVPPVPGPEKPKAPEVARTDRPEKAPEPPKVAVPVSPPPAPYVPTAATQQRSRVPVVPFALAGVGVAAAGVGTVFGLQSRSNLRDVEDRFEGGQFPTQAEAQAVRAQLDDARSQARVANVLFGTAAAAATGAIVTYLFSGGGMQADTREAR